MEPEKIQLRMTAYASLTAALIAVGAFLAVPVGPVPIVLQNLFVFMAGLLLGARWGTAAVAIYLLAGACGLPVFSGGRGGIGHIVGPTGGYLVGFLPAAYLVGVVSSRGRNRVVFDVAGMLLGTAAIYVPGVAWLKLTTGMSLTKALALGMVPFLIGDALKIAVAVPLARKLRPLVGGTADVQKIRR